MNITVQSISFKDLKKLKNQIVDYFIIININLKSGFVRICYIFNLIYTSYKLVQEY